VYIQKFYPHYSDGAPMGIGDELEVSYRTFTAFHIVAWSTGSSKVRSAWKPSRSSITASAVTAFAS
jgi:hypothetical protein